MFNGQMKHKNNKMKKFKLIAQHYDMTPETVVYLVSEQEVMGQITVSLTPTEPHPEMVEALALRTVPMSKLEEING